MSCPFYGKHAQPGFSIIDQRGNQCAIIVGSYSPCFMEVTMAEEPDARNCILLEGVRRLREIWGDGSKRMANVPPSEPRP